MQNVLLNLWLKCCSSILHYINPHQYQECLIARKGVAYLAPEALYNLYNLIWRLFLLAGTVERGNEKNGLFCIILHCIAFNTLSHSISPYAFQRSPPENMDHFISLCITLHHAGGLVRHWILGNERSTPKYGREPSQSQSEPHRWPAGFPNQNLEYNVRQLSFVFSHQDHHCLWFPIVFHIEICYSIRIAGFDYFKHKFSKIFVIMFCDQCRHNFQPGLSI